MVDYEGLATEGYTKNSPIFTAIQFKARAIGSIPLRAYIGTQDNPEPAPDRHPLAVLLRRPNRVQGISQFLTLSHVYLNLSGDVFIGLVRERTGIQAMYTLRPDRVNILMGPEGLAGYRWIPSGGTIQDAVHFLPEDLVHIKYPNPLDPWEGVGYGLSPLCSAARSADVDNAATDFLKIFFEGGALFMGLLETDQNLSEAEIATIQTRWGERYGGYRNWAERVGVLARGLKYTPIVPTFDQMSFDTLDERNESRILAALGVPPILVGARVGLTHSTYSNYAQARLAVWEDTLIPEAQMYETELVNALSGGGAFPGFDYSKVPAMQERALTRVTAFQALFNSGYPRDQAAQIVGLPAGSSPGGDISYMPISLVPAGRTPSTTPPADDEEEPDEEEVEVSEAQALSPVVSAEVTSPWTPEQCLLLWRIADRAATSHENQFKRVAQGNFRRELAAILALLHGEQVAARARRGSVNYKVFLDDTLQYLNTRSNPIWQDAAMQLANGMFDTALDRWQVVGIIPIGDPALVASEMMRYYPIEFAQAVTGTTTEHIRLAIQQGIENGWGIERMQNQLQSLFEVWIEGGSPDESFLLERLPNWRAELIARYETIRSYNLASLGIFGAAAVPLKQWLATMDDRVRPDHAMTNGQIKPVRQPFNVAGYQMMYPGDLSMGAPLEEAMNCRCAMAPIL